jgi:hypothetical protein
MLSIEARPNGNYVKPKLNFPSSSHGKKKVKTEKERER